jgi:hypothetical protein
MSESGYPAVKVDVESEMRRWRAANQEKRAEMLYEAVLRTTNQIVDLQASRVRHGRRLDTVEERLKITRYRDPEDSAAFILTDHELKQKTEELKRHEDDAKWRRRAVFGAIITIVTALMVSAIVTTAARVASIHAAP